MKLRTPKNIHREQQKPLTLYGIGLINQIMDFTLFLRSFLAFVSFFCFATFSRRFRSLAVRAKNSFALPLTRCWMDSVGSGMKFVIKLWVYSILCPNEAATTKKTWPQTKSSSVDFKVKTFLLLSPFAPNQKLSNNRSNWFLRLAQIDFYCHFYELWCFLVPNDPFACQTYADCRLMKTRKNSQAR